jgi:hypothetical protein
MAPVNGGGSPASKPPHFKGGASRDQKGHRIECMHLYCVCIFAFSVS